MSITSEPIDASYTLISADSHIVEPADLWTERIDSKFKDRAPKIVRLESGGDWWYSEDTLVTSPFSGTQTGLRFTDPEKISIDVDINDLRDGAYMPDETIKDMDIDGVKTAIIYPTTGVAMMRLPDSDLVSAIGRAYNDWLAEFCQAHPARLKGLGVINTDDIPAAVKELERCAGIGMVGGTIPIRPLPDKPYDLPEYDPLWAAAQDLQMPLSLHISSQRSAPIAPGAPNTVSLLSGKARHGTLANDALVKDSLSEMIFGGVFERFPNLRVGSVEVEIGWAPFWIMRMDYGYTLIPSQAKYKFKNGAMPSDYVHSNLFFSFLEDEIGIRLRDIIGVDNLLWGSDYPHVESTWPKSREILEGRVLKGCTLEEKTKIAGGNAARIYRLD